jgi:hypothetical protein
MNYKSKLKSTINKLLIKKINIKIIKIIILIKYNNYKIKLNNYKEIKIHNL